MRRLAVLLASVGAAGILSGPTSTHDRRIDPAVPSDASWTLTDPTYAQCSDLAEMVHLGKLAPEARYDPAAPCEHLYGGWPTYGCGCPGAGLEDDIDRR